MKKGDKYYVVDLSNKDRCNEVVFGDNEYLDQTMTFRGLAFNTKEEAKEIGKNVMKVFMSFFKIDKEELYLEDNDNGQNELSDDFIQSLKDVKGLEFSDPSQEDQIDPVYE